MKCISLTLLISGMFFLAAAQQNSKIDDAQLMEFFQSQRYNEALDYLKKSFPEPLNDVHILSRLGYVSQLANKLADAEGYYQRAFDLDTTNQSILFNMAGINLKRGNMTKAETYYKIIVQKDTGNFTVYKQLAGLSERKNDTPATVGYFEKANRINRNDVEVASELSDYYVALKRFDKAYAILKKASENDPNDVLILLSTEKLVYNEQKWQETVEVGNKLMRLDAATPLVVVHLGISYYNLANYACGAETFASLKADQQTEYSLYYAGLCYKRLGDNAKAIDCLNEAIYIGISPNIASYYGEIAGIQEKGNRHRKAAQAYQKALQFKETATVYYLLASLYDTKLKDKANAIRYYRKYLASKPSGKDQNTYLAYAKSRIEKLRH